MYFLGIDIGSSSSKAVIIDENQNVLAIKVKNIGTGTNGPAVVIGERVTAGDVIGSLDASCLFENAIPVHLHLEMLENGKRIDPMSLIPSD